MDSGFATWCNRAAKLASRIELGYLARGHDRQERAATIVSQFTAPAITIAAALLAACGTSSSQPAPQACPTVLFLKGAERTADYRPGPDPRPADLRYLAVLTDLVSVCRYEDDGVDVALRFNLIAEQGPAYGGGPLQLTYFVASLGPEQQVLSKPLLDAEVAFPEGQQRAGITEEMTLRISDVTPAEGQQYAVFLGFQLDEAEMGLRLEGASR
jgi:hypothetical protein